MSRWDAIEPVIPLTHVISVLASCWVKAEEHTLDFLNRAPSAAREEDVTFLLRANLSREVAEASGRRRFEEAFLLDLEEVEPGLADQWTWRWGKPLIASVGFHGKKREGRSGGDFALLLRQPQIERDFDGFVVKAGRRRALVAQAKRHVLRAPSRNGPELRPNQKARISQNPDHFALVLYECEDETAGRFSELRWQPCEGHSIGTVSSWLTNWSFPNLQKSEDILRRLAEQSLGTEDPKLCDELERDDRDCFLIPIDIHWGRDEPPEEGIRLTWSEECKAEQVFLLGVGR